MQQAKHILAALSLCLVSVPASAWDGTSQDTGASITIERGNLVRTGRTIDIYDSSAGEYRSVDVEDVNDTGSSVEIEIYDPATGATETLEMEDN